MGIDIWDVIDKNGHLKLGLWAVPNARDPNLPPALWLRVVKQHKGMSVTLSCDMGGEQGKLISLATRVRAKHQPHLDEDALPAVRAVKSTKNITRKRAWRPLWEKDLANIAHVYKAGSIDAGYHPNDPFHEGLVRWVWAQIVQKRLDELMVENGLHRICFQKKSLLPTGARRIDIYNHPERYSGSNLLIPIPEEDIDHLLAEYNEPHLTQFGKDEEVTLYTDLHQGIGNPEFVAAKGWGIFWGMVQLYISRL